MENEQQPEENWLVRLEKYAAKFAAHIQTEFGSWVQEGMKSIAPENTDETRTAVFNSLLHVFIGCTAANATNMSQNFTKELEDRVVDSIREQFKYIRGQQQIIQAVNAKVQKASESTIIQPDTKIIEVSEMPKKTAPKFRKVK